MKLSKATIYQALTTAAQAHGADSEPDMEVGDLQEALEIALKYIPEEAIPQLIKDVSHLTGLAEVLEEYDGTTGDDGAASTV